MSQKLPVNDLEWMNVEKPVTNLDDKTVYVIHTKVHRVIKFNQNT